MNNTATDINEPALDWIGAVHRLGPSLAETSARHDEDGSFIDENYRRLEEENSFSVAVPQALGGGGASLGELCGITRELAHYCGSTALSYAMHSHPVAANVFKHNRG